MFFQKKPGHVPGFFLLAVKRVGVEGARRLGEYRVGLTGMDQNQCFESPED